MKSVKVGDLVKEVLPLMAGDAIPRVGLVTETYDNYANVLFVDIEEVVPYNTIKKVEA